jgi:hypothetical protein
MIEAETTYRNLAVDLQMQLDRIAERGLSRTAFRIMVDARESIEITARPSKPGHPPHSRRGALRQAIGFAVNGEQRAAFIGPRYSKVNRIGQTLEFGGLFRNRKYAARPFMRPALERNLNYFAASFGG